MFSENENGFFNDGIDLGNDVNADFGGFEAFDASGFGDAFETNSSKDIKKQEDAPVAGVIDDKEPAKDADETVKTEVNENEKVTGTSEATDKKSGDVQSDGEEESIDFFTEAVNAAETKQAENEKNSLIDKLPIFSYANAKEEIVDTSKTFDALRIEKAEDFAELDDASAVSWKMTYGTITKNVTTPKKTTIAALKKQIEDSKNFVTMLKKAKGDVECKVSPSVVAKRKGIKANGYKDAFLSMDDAMESGKVISFVPSDDGNVYEVRANKIGTFVAKADNVTILDKVRAGFTPALPKMPNSLLMQIISFFRSYISSENEFEALVHIHWSFKDSRYYAYVPKQKVTKMRVNASVPIIDEEDFPLVMEIHSHNTMPAVFSPTDDMDERATRLYTVIGKLDNFFPDIKTRFCVNGNFVEVNPKEVFEAGNYEYQNNWSECIETIGRRYEL